MSDKIELLSPAGNFETLAAAVNNGADAVYFGSKLFNARRLADNFTNEELKKAIQYAHLHQVKVYLTLNTLVKNQEINAFLGQVSQAENFQADGIILQDLSFAPLIKKHFPKLELHASTQATIMNTPSVKFWQKDIDVFVLARELTKEQVKEIYGRTNAHLETFIHGHLCSSYSGQCLISSLIGERSGNRGMCASSCRKPYNGDQYLISAKDLCLIDCIPEIAESGVKTVKIEGRMKPAEYVALTTRYYRNQLNAYYAGKKAPVTEQMIQNLKMAFNRNFTRGYFDGEKSIIDPLIPTKRGIYLGKVRYDLLELTEDLEVQDGVGCVQYGETNGDFVRKIWVEGQEVNKARRGERVKLNVKGFENGATIFLTFKHQGDNLLGKIKKIPLHISLNVKEGENPLFKIKLKDQIITEALEVAATKPRSQPLTKDQLLIELQKYDSPIFHFNKIEIETDASFVPKSLLTKFRNNFDQMVLDRLLPSKETNELLPVPDYPIVPANENKLHIMVYSLNAVHQALKAGADVIYYDAFASDVYKAADLVRGKVPFFLHTPMVLEDEDLVTLAKIVHEVRPDGLLVNNVGVLGMNFPGQKVLGYQMNIFNDHQLNFYGIPAVASLELSGTELAEFHNKKNLIYFAHGYPVVMTFRENIPAGSLKDEKGYLFKLRRTGTGATEMLYSKSIGLLQHTSQILKAGVSQLYLDLYSFSDNEVYELVRAYRLLMEGKRVPINQFKKDVTIGNLEKGVM